jgi:predicted Zn finger-like uncharacterized protein
VIVTCPNCEARYKMSDAVLARGARLRCAACDHRWVPPVPTEVSPAAAVPVSPQAAVPVSPQAAVPVPPPRPRAPITEADEEAAFAAVQEQIRARWQDAATPATPADPQRQAGEASDDPGGDSADYELGGEPATAITQADDSDEAPRRSSAMLRSVVAVIAGLALSVAAAGLWANQFDLAAIPLLGPALAQLTPQSPLKINVKGVVTVLPSGRRVLEVTGNISNTGKRPAKVPPLAATLSSPAGTALRWTISPPLEILPPGQKVAFTNTVTGFPADAQTLGISPAR